MEKNEVSVDALATKILVIRGKKVMLDQDLAALYGVKVKVLNQAVKRNIKRFPDDFMFRLTWQETTNLKSQIVTSKSRSQFVTLKHGQNIKYLPYAFSEQGVAMLSSVLNNRPKIRAKLSLTSCAFSGNYG